MAWTAGSYVRSGRLLARALTDRKAAEELIHEVADDLAVASRAVSDVARAIAEGVPVSRALIDGGAALAAVMPDPVDVVLAEHEPTLRERGEDLLERSRDVWSDEEPHPAYVRILDDLAPDEARSWCTCSAPARSPRSTSAPVGRWGCSAPASSRPG